MRTNDVLSAVLLLSVTCQGQTDSLNIPEVEVQARITDRPSMREPGSMAVIGESEIATRRVQTLLPVLNAEPGVRMEERSPGSFRLSVRGSLLRSPFGVRNTKVYIGEMPLTTAAGETYLNLLDQGMISRIEIHKGPDGSLFGANSGGVVRLDVSTRPTVDLLYGSYNLHRAGAGYSESRGRQRYSVAASLQGSGGHREHSAMLRKFAHIKYRNVYREGYHLELFFLAADLQYKTPGALTESQYISDPWRARPATPFSPGAKDQDAGIRNITGLFSATHQWSVGKKWRHVACVFGSVTDFKNPFITNYETRDEKNAGARTWLRYATGDVFRYQAVVGAEGQAHIAGISNYVNNRGVKGTPLAQNDLNATQGFIFTSHQLDISNEIFIEGSVSLNADRMVTRDKTTGSEFSRNLEPQVMPRLAGSWLLARYLTFRALISRGYSAPTLQEMRPAPAAFNASLQPEHGWNYESGFRIRTGAFLLDVTAFTYRLQEAITRRVDAWGTEYFVNAGNTRQPGVELQASWQKSRNVNEGNKTPYPRITAGATFYRFVFENYQVDGTDLSGNRLTGVPPGVYSAQLLIPLSSNLDVFLQGYHAEEAPMDDNNSAYSPAYTLLTARISYGWRFVKHFGIQLSAGCDNILDQRYTAGPDLNAFGGRFYNVAPGRNYFARLAVDF